VTPDAFRPDRCRAFLDEFLLVDEHGRQLDMAGTSPSCALNGGAEAKQEFAGRHETPAEYTQLTDWTFGELPN